jgi:CPA2 family monovalent cation:H+ antiporter-2
VPFIVVDQNRERVEALREAGLHAVWGDAADPLVLVQAHVARASVLVVATPDTFDVRRVAETALTLRPGIEIVARSAGADADALLQTAGVARVFVAETEVAQAIAAHAVTRWRGTATPRGAPVRG